MARLLQQLFRRQAMQVASLVTLDGDVPELAGWVKVTAEAAKPLLLRMTQHGIIETQVRIARKLGKAPEPVGAAAGDGMRRYTVPASEVFGKSWQVRKAVDAKVKFDLFNPRVIDAVDAATFAFCRETMETARTDLATALRDLRRLMRRGLERGDALRLLARRVHDIFADPQRAFRIAVTEASRAQHAGQLMAAKESVVVKGKSWVASADACENCLAMEERGTIPLDEPFYVDPKGGPYATVHAPPFHPHCFCSLNEEIE